ncbi:hypothetical protein FRC01_013149 [Tulasnella sp. 417]|nr:hypothetical protein FRC01_013149 [Tulasnella sp. 417]
MSSEQIGQLYELMHATRDIWKTPEELGEQSESASGTKDGNSSQRQMVRGHRPGVKAKETALPKNQKATYPIVIVFVTRHHPPVPDHTFNLSQRISSQIRCFVAFWERTAIDKIVPDPVAHPIQAEKVWTFENAIPNSRSQIQVAEEERKRLCFGSPMPDPEVRIVER